MTRSRKTLRVEVLEPRLTPVVGAFAPAPEAGTGVGFDGVVQVFAGDSLGTGTVLSTGRHVITAAHVLDDDGDHVPDGPVTVRFELPGGVIDMPVPFDHVVIWPGWTGFGGDDEVGTDANDLAVIVLPSLAPSGPGGADRYDLYRAADEVGGEFLAVGYGRTGVGRTGNVPGTAGTRRYGYNRFDTTGAIAPDDALIVPGLGLVADFDDGSFTHDALGRRLGVSSPGFGAQEAAISFGDSGGPAFLFDGSHYLLAGVAADLISGGIADADLDLGRDPETNSSFGDLVGYTRVSAFASQIDAFTAGAYDLTIDLNYQPGGNDGTRDAVQVTQAGDAVEFEVNGFVVLTESRARLKSVTVVASSDGGAFAVGPTVAGDLLVREVGFAPPADARPVVTAAPLAYLQAVAPVGAANPKQLFAVGADAGAEPRVRVYDQAGAMRFDFLAFDPAFTGGVRVAVADVNGDGFPDVVIGSGPGMPPTVRIVDGRGTGPLDAFLAFEKEFTGGVFVATADFDGDGRGDIAITPDEGGGPRVRVIDGATLTVAGDFLGIDDPNFRGGARPAAGDVNGDGTPDLVVAAGFGGGPRVAVFDGRTVTGGTPARLVGDFFVFEPELRNGVYVAAGDIDGDGFAEVIAGGGPGGGPRVFALSGQALLSGAAVQVANFFAGDPETRGGIRVTTKDLDADAKADIVTGTGPGGGARVTVYIGAETPPDGVPPVRFDFDPFLGLNVDGVFVG